MDRDKFEKACEIDHEIERLDMLIKCIEAREGNDSLMDPRVNDFAFLVGLLGANDVISLMRVRKRMLEKEFDEL